jgi:hypothetical protein
MRFINHSVDKSVRIAELFTADDGGQRLIEQHHALPWCGRRAPMLAPRYADAAKVKLGSFVSWPTRSARPNASSLERRVVVEHPLR